MVIRSVSRCYRGQSCLRPLVQDLSELKENRIIATSVTCSVFLEAPPSALAGGCRRGLQTADKDHFQQMRIWHEMQRSSHLRKTSCKMWLCVSVSLLLSAVKINESTRTMREPDESDGGAFVRWTESKSKSPSRRPTSQCFSKTMMKIGLVILGLLIFIAGFLYIYDPAFTRILLISQGASGYVGVWLLAWLATTQQKYTNPVFSTDWLIDFVVLIVSFQWYIRSIDR